MFSFSCNIGEIVDVDYIIDRDNCIDIQSVSINGNSVKGLLSDFQLDDIEYAANVHYQDFAKHNDFLE